MKEKKSGGKKLNSNLNSIEEELQDSFMEDMEDEEGESECSDCSQVEENKKEIEEPEIEMSHPDPAKREEELIDKARTKHR